MISHWLFLRGLTREQRHWGTFPSTLMGAIPDGHAHLLDLPGFGTEHHRPAPPTIEATTEDTRERWLRLRDAHPGPWHLVAISLGGMVAQQWVYAHPRDFQHVVLINTSASNVSTPWERMSLSALSDVARAVMTSDLRTREQIILRLTTRLQGDRASSLAEEWARYATEHPVSVRNAAVQLVAASTWRAPRALPVPTLVLTSQQDGLVSTVCSHKLAARYGAELRIHPEAGHDLPADAPEWVAQQIADFTQQRAAA
ncbi:MAG: alpha/beta hydrolase [Myxococcota bacterium]